MSDKIPYSTTYRTGDSQLDTIEFIGPVESPHEALWSLAKAQNWDASPRRLTGDRLTFTAATCKGENIHGTVYPSATTGHVLGSL